MEKFKAGDRVRRVGDSWNWVLQGRVYTVKGGLTGFVSLEEIGGEYSADWFELEREKVYQVELNLRSRSRESLDMLYRDIRPMTQAEYRWMIDQEVARVTALNQREAASLPKPAPAGIFALTKM